MNVFAMDILTVPHVGSVALGIVMGALVWYFVARFSEFTPKALGAVVSVVVGGAVLKWFENECTRGAVWYYPIGLLVSTGLFFVFWLAGPEGEKYDKFRKNF